MEEGAAAFEIPINVIYLLVIRQAKNMAALFSWLSSKTQHCGRKLSKRYFKKEFTNNNIP